MKPILGILKLTEVVSATRVRYVMRCVQLSSFLIPSQRLIASDGVSGDAYTIKRALPKVCNTFLILGRNEIEEVILSCVLVGDTRTAHLGEYVDYGKYDNLSRDSLGLIISDRTIHAELPCQNDEINRQLVNNHKDSRSWASGEWRGASYLMLDAGLGTRPTQALFLETLGGAAAGVFFDLSGLSHWVEND